MLNKRVVDFTLRDHIVINLVVMAPFAIAYGVWIVKQKFNAKATQESE